MIVAPSFLSADFLNIADELKAVEEAGADWLHLDVMDGHFVPNLTFGIPIIQKVRRGTRLPLDVHLMVTNPQDYLSSLHQIGVNSISFHQETVYHSHRFVQQIKESGIKAGIALNPSTPIQTLNDILSDLDFVLLMSVNPGFGGQEFLPLVLSKISELRELANTKNPNLLVEVDGGITDRNAHLLKQRGVDILVAGSFVFSADDYKEQIRRLR